VELFSHYGVAIRPAEQSSDSNLAFCAIIGFTGNDMRGSLLLACSREPLTLAGENVHGIRDWLAELANQMLGRIKNRLLSLGTVIYASTPIILRGEHLAPLDDQPRPQLFHANGGVLSVLFEAAMLSDLTLAATPDVSASVREGETLLF
jgi:hypothetical protein